MTVSGTGQACTFILINSALNIFPSAALISGQPAHGTASAGLTSGGTQVFVSYTPQRGYAGPDNFGVTIEPNDFGIAIAVTVQPPS